MSNGATNLEKNIVTDISETMVRLIQPTPIKLIAKGPLYIKVDSKTQCSVVEHPKDCSYKFVTEILYVLTFLVKFRKFSWAVFMLHYHSNDSLCHNIYAGPALENNDFTDYRGHPAFLKAFNFKDDIFQPLVTYH